MPTVRTAMSTGADCVRTDQSAADAARIMAALGVGALAICGQDDEIKGVVTDRDLVTKVIAKGRSAGEFPAGDLNQAEAVTVGADDDLSEAVKTMLAHGVCRLPVIDGDQLVGMLGVGDIAAVAPEWTIGELRDLFGS